MHFTIGWGKNWWIFKEKEKSLSNSNWDLPIINTKPHIDPPRQLPPTLLSTGYISEPQHWFCETIPMNAITWRMN